MTIAARWRSAAVRQTWLLWGYLLLVTVAELCTALVSVQAGLTLHALLLFGLTLQGARGTGSERDLLLLLTIAPLIRVLSLTLPLTQLPQLAWYPVVSIPILVALWMALRAVRLSRHDLGLSFGNPASQAALAGVGFGLGALEYSILKPEPLVAASSWSTLLTAALILVLFTGFTEELVFRGFLQPVALSAMGGWGLVYVSSLFAVLHIGYQSLHDLILVFAAGMLFSALVCATGSIVGVSLAHGVANVTLYLIMPNLAAQPPGLVPTAVTGAVWGGTAIGVLAAAYVGWKAMDRERARLATLGARAGPAPAGGELPSPPLVLLAPGAALPVLPAESGRELAALPPVEARPAADETPSREPLRLPVTAGIEPAATRRVPVAGLAEALADVPDPRAVRGRRYSLPSLLSLATCALLADARSIHAIAGWGRAQQPERLIALGFLRGQAPCAKTFYSIFARLDVAAFETALRRWALQGLSRAGRPVAMDGEGLPGVRGIRLPRVRLVDASPDGHELVLEDVGDLDSRADPLRRERRRSVALRAS